MKSRGYTLVILAAALALLPWAVVDSASAASLALVGGTVYASPDEEPIRNGVVVIQQDKIVGIGKKGSVRLPRGVEELDCSGMTLTAGFWNSHVHFFERKWADASSIPAAELAAQLQDMLTQYGFTSVFDLGSDWENTRRIRDRIESGEVVGPRIRSTGPGVLPRNPGTPPEAVLHILGVMKPTVVEVADASEASAGTRKLLGEGVDAIKVFASAPSGASLSQEIITAAATEAHSAGKLVFVHPNSSADVLTAVRAGVDIIAHTTPNGGPWDGALIAAMKERQVALIPTMKIFTEFLRHDRASARQKVVDAEIGQLRTWVAVGGTVLFGTDVSYVNYDPAEEYMLMAAAGMSFRQILTSLTTAPAAKFGESQRLGRIAPGLTADVVVLEQDPAQSIRALANVRYVIRDGKVIYRKPK